MLCHRCGARNSDSANFCSSCGASQQRDTSEDTLTLHVVDGEIVDATPSVEAEDAAPPDCDIIVVNSGPSTGARFALEADVVTAGRETTSDIFLDDVTVSREHAVFARTPTGRLTVTDKASLNGTYVNHIRVDETILDSGDEVQIGKFKLIYIAARDR